MGDTVRISALVLACWAWASNAAAAIDSFALGDGHWGSLLVSSPNLRVNQYAAVTAAVRGGDTSVAVSTSAGFSAGDLVLLHQTGGLTAPASGAPGPFDLGPTTVGWYELFRVASVAPGTLRLAPAVSVDLGGPAQVIRVPEYTDVAVSPDGGIVAKPWDGKTGGVLAFFATGTVRNDGLLNVSGLGFRGGPAGPGDSLDGGACEASDAAPQAARKGEGLATELFVDGASGVARAANGAGGGVCSGPSTSPAAGGGGGGNAGVGGRGGLSSPYDRPVGGQGGAAIVASLRERLLLGGGGGASWSTMGSAGGAGGGAMLIRAASLVGGGRVVANGLPGQSGTAGGGGGAGGTAHIRVEGEFSCAAIEAGGGAGGFGCTTPGGGGGGGSVFVQAHGAASCAAAALAGVAPYACATTRRGAEPESADNPLHAGLVQVTPPEPFAPPPSACQTGNGSQCNLQVGCSCSSPPARGCGCQTIPSVAVLLALGLLSRLVLTGRSARRWGNRFGTASRRG